MKSQFNPKKLELERREQRIAELAQKNEHHLYMYDKKYPDFATPYETWIKQLAHEHQI